MNDLGFGIADGATPMGPPGGNTAADHQPPGGSNEHIYDPYAGYNQAFPDGSGSDHSGDDGFKDMG